MVLPTSSNLKWPYVIGSWWSKHQKWLCSVTYRKINISCIFFSFSTCRNKTKKTLITEKSYPNIFFHWKDKRKKIILEITCWRYFTQYGRLTGNKLIFCIVFLYCCMLYNVVTHKVTLLPTCVQLLHPWNDRLVHVDVSNFEKNILCIFSKCLATHHRKPSPVPVTIYRNREKTLSK